MIRKIKRSIERKNFVNLQLFANKVSKSHELSNVDTVAPTLVQAGEQAQSKYSPHTIDKNRPKVRDAGYHTSSAPFATGGFGGHLTPFGYKEYYAGCKMGKIKLDFIAHMESLRHPSFDRLKMRFFVVYIPNTRIWRNAKKFAAQKSNPLDSNVPTVVPTVLFPTVAEFVTGLNTSDLIRYPISTAYRNSIAYCYFGRIPQVQLSPGQHVKRNYNALLPRGYIAAVNDCFIDRTTQAPFPEWDTDTVTPAEAGYMYSPTGELVQVASGPSLWEVNEGTLLKRATTVTHYWNNYRSEVYSDNSPVDNTSLWTHNVTQQQIDEFRSQAENIDLSDEEVIARIRGSRIASENVCRVIGQATIPVDISLQPNTSEGTLSLGADGALSYTKGDIEIDLGGFEAPLDGYLHYFWDVISVNDGMTAHGINYEVLKSHYTEFYRPALSVIKDRPLYTSEVNDNRPGSANPPASDTIQGWIHNWSELFRTAKCIRGDFTQIAGTLLQNEVRQPGGGFSFTSTLGSNGNLPNKSNWHLLREPMNSMALSLEPLKRNYSDYAIHRLLLVQKGVHSSNSIHIQQYFLPQTFSLYGSISETYDQPVDAKVKRKFIPYGEQ